MLVPFKSTDVIGAINLPVCTHTLSAARPSLRTEIWQLWMSFVLPASVWEVRWRVEAYELWHAYCHNDGEEEEDSRERESKKKRRNMSILSAVSCLCLHAIYMLHQTMSFVLFSSICFLRIKVVFLLTQGWIRVDKVSDPARRTGI